MNSSETINKFLIVGAICSAVAALAHLGCVIFGGDWYRFFGAGEHMAVLAEQGHWYPTVVTTSIVVVLFIWALYALSGAKVIAKLPFLKLGLCTISSLYILRGVAWHSSASCRCFQTTVSVFGLLVLVFACLLALCMQSVHTRLGRI